MRSAWPLARLTAPNPAVCGDRLEVAAAPERVGAAEALLVAGTPVSLPDGERYVIATLESGPAAWFSSAGTFVVDAAQRAVYAPEPAPDRAIWEHRIVCWALPSLLCELGVTVLHGCVIARGDRAWIACGPSGRGKTTLALALREAGWELVSDDVAVLGSRREELVVFPGPLGSRVLGPDGTKSIQPWSAPPSLQPLAVAGLLVLAPRSGQLSIEALAPHLGFLELARCIRAGARETGLHLLPQVAQLARDRPTLRVSLPDDLSALGAAVATLSRWLDAYTARSS